MCLQDPGSQGCSYQVKVQEAGPVEILEGMALLTPWSLISSPMCGEKMLLFFSLLIYLVALHLHRSLPSLLLFHLPTLYPFSSPFPQKREVSTANPLGTSSHIRSEHPLPLRPVKAAQLGQVIQKQNACGFKVCSVGFLSQ